MLIKTDSALAQSAACTLESSVHGTQHTIAVKRISSATGSLYVKVKVPGCEFEQLYDGTTPVVIDISAPKSVVFFGCIDEVYLEPVSSISGTFDAFVYSQGIMPQGR